MISERENVGFRCCLSLLLAIALACPVMLEADACPPYTKYAVPVGDPADLPGGFLAYYYDPRSPLLGLFVTPLQSHSRRLVPNTRDDKPRFVNISDDGKWLLYLEGRRAGIFLIRTNGSHKTEVPLWGCFPSVTGFYRHSPYGTEVFYDSRDSSDAVVYSIPVALTDSSVTFGERRLLLDFGDKISLEPDYNISICYDQVFTVLKPLHEGRYKQRTGYLTIPDSGRGTGTDEHIYSWEHDDTSEVWGCEHAMSHDGTVTLANFGGQGFIYGFQDCLPVDHKGFYVTPFRRIDDPPLDVHENVTIYGTSINWCPTLYQFGVWTEVDFRGWQFSNQTEYLSGCVSGTKSPSRSIWVVNWKTNVWTQVTPTEDSVITDFSAVYFGDYHDEELLPCDTCDTTNTPTKDTTGGPPDRNDPIYDVIYPEGGEVFEVGEVCTVKVTSFWDGNATIKLKIGPHLFRIPGLETAVNPRTNPIWIFVMPKYFYEERIDPVSQDVVTVRVHAESDRCKIVLEHYNTSSGYRDESDDYFTIVDNTAVEHYDPCLVARPSLSHMISMGRELLQFAVPGMRGGVDVCIKLYDARGRAVRTVAQGLLAPGRYTCELNHRGPGVLAPGLYLCVMKVGAYTDSIRLRLM